MNYLQHEIQFVSEEVMPEGHDFVLVETSDGVVIFFREGATAAREVLEQAWAAYRAADMTRPPRRLRSAS